MSEVSAGDPRTYDSYLSRTGQPSPNLPDWLGTYVGRRATFSAAARYAAGSGGQMIDASDQVSFGVDENGGAVDVQAGYVLIERETGRRFSVVDARETDNGYVVATCKSSGPAAWVAPTVVP